MKEYIRDYKIISKLGQGGMGEVYLAEDINLERKVALKVLSPVLTSNEELVQRFRQEAKVQAGLVHKNIITLYAFFQEDGVYYMAMEFAAGRTLRDILREKGKLTEAETINIFIQLLDGVGYAHSMGIVHRDLKPANIIVNEIDKKVKVLDFGIAKVLSSKGLTTVTGQRMGTVLYMSPEQIRATKDVDQRTDIYSLGIILFEMLCGRLPFNADPDSEFDLMTEIVNGDLPALLAGEKNLSSRFARLITGMTTKKPEDRPVTCFKIEQEITGIPAAAAIEPVDDSAKEVEPPNSLDIIKIKPRIAIIPEMVEMKGGTYSREHTNIWGRKKSFDVELDDFCIGRFLLTQEEWISVMLENPSSFQGRDLPVERVNWFEANKYCEKLSELTGLQFRLPTEAEWEFAARGGIQSSNAIFSGGNNPDDVAWYSANAVESTHPVGEKLPNELGIFDMTGNVWEWCSDYFGLDYYKDAPRKNPKGPAEGQERILRGGSWFNNPKCYPLITRNSDSPACKYSFYGFRVAMDNKKR